MTNYRIILTLEYLMFSNNIEEDVKNLDHILSNFNPEIFESMVENMTQNNYYTEKNIQNLRKILETYKDKFEDYEKLLSDLDSIEPSYDYYYYEYLSKYDALKCSIKSEYDVIPVELMEQSIRFDFYAFSGFYVDNEKFEKKWLPVLTNNRLYNLFLKKLLIECQQALDEPIVIKRIKKVLETGINNSNDKKYIEESKKILNKIIYYSKNKNVEIYDLEKFTKHYNRAFFEYLITNNVDYKVYMEYIKSDKFLSFLEEYITGLNEESNNLIFIYNHDMTARFKKIIKSIYDEDINSSTKIRCNTLLSIWPYNRVTDTKVLYEIESVSTSTFKENIKNIAYDKLMILKMKFSLNCDYVIMKIYSMDDKEFEQFIDIIPTKQYIGWMRKMMSLDKNFFLNEILRERTFKILDSLNIDNKELKKEKEKMKKKIVKLNKGLEY